MNKQAETSPDSENTLSDAQAENADGACDSQPAAHDENDAAREQPKGKRGISGKASVARDAVRKSVCKAASWSGEHLDPQRHDGLWMVRFLERMLERIRSAMAAAPADSLAERLVHYGNLAALAAMVLTLANGLLASVRHFVFFPLPVAVALALALAAFQYAGNKFLKAGGLLLSSTPSKLASPVFLNAFALLHAAAAVIFLAGGVLLAVHARNIGVLVIGLALAVVSYGVSFISLYPERINVSIDPVIGAGEEALGILSFFVKVVVRMAPIFYGVGMIAGMLIMLGACVARLGPTGITDLGRQAGFVLLLSAAAPFAVYVIFVFYQLLLDVLRAILVLPREISSGRAQAR